MHAQCITHMYRSEWLLRRPFWSFELAPTSRQKSWPARVCVRVRTFVFCVCVCVCVYVRTRMHVFIHIYTPSSDAPRVSSSASRFALCVQFPTSSASPAPVPSPSPPFFSAPHAQVNHAGDDQSWKLSRQSGPSPYMSSPSKLHNYPHPGKRYYIDGRGDRY